MKTFLLDVNVWVAATFESHLHHSPAMQWLAEHPTDQFAFCRTTQQGFLRIATNPRAIQEKSLTLPQAWEAYDTMLRHPRIIFLDEPLELERHWRLYTENESFSPKIWMDAYPAGFARAADLHLLTFDSGFGRYDGLVYTHLA
jgi:uncharacterized protein